MNDLFNEPYYEASAAPARLAETQTEDTLRHVLDSKARKVVEETVRRWNRPLRDEVRSVTALRFIDETGRTAASVPVAVVDGPPRSLAEATQNVNRFEWWLALHRPALETADGGLRLLVDNEQFLARHLPGISDQLRSVHITRTLVADVLKGAPERSILERFRDIDEDVLGAYWIHASKIQLYWMALAIFAPLLRVPLSTLTAVVLCHELVHAYTHRGLDIDGGAWLTHEFIQTNTFVKEGLAQFYTERVMNEFRLRLPDGLETFNRKTAHQAVPYNAYKDWLGKGKQPSLEAVRLAMIEFRNAVPAKTTHADFIAILESAQRRIRPATSV